MRTDKRLKRRMKTIEEKRNESMQVVAEGQEEAYKSGSMHYMDSREVAEIVGKNHGHLMRDIGRYIKELTQSNFGFSEFFLESSYKDTSGRNNKCYLVTRKGCEFIAHKLTGIKGTKFTATYINRFHEMEGRDSEKLMELRQMVEEHEQDIRNQMRLNELIVDRLKALIVQQDNSTSEDSISVSISGENEIIRRRRNLNQLVKKMADACGWDKVFAMHRLYKSIEDALDISLDAYQEIYQAETMNDHVSTFELILAHDRLYKTAVKICSNTISKMKCL